MADLARALQTPVPATQPAPQQQSLRHDGSAGDVKDYGATQRDAKNERDRLRRKEKRAADAKAAHAKAVEAALRPKKKAAAKSKKKKAKKKAAYRASDRAVMQQLPRLAGKKKRRGRPPGAKNKPKVGLAVALVPAPGVLPRVTKAPGVDGLLAQIGLAVSLLNAMPEHARKVVLDAVK